MAIIVDKKQKRKDIALSCKRLILENGISNLTVSKVAKTAGIGKGTIYEYFKNKDEIVFELVNVLMQEHNIAKEKKLSHLTTTKGKIKVFFDFFYNDEDFELRELYKQFIAITLISKPENMIAFQAECFDIYTTWIDRIVQEGISNKELIPHAKELVGGLFTYAQGVFIINETTNPTEDLKIQINSQIDTLFSLLEVKS